MRHWSTVVVQHWCTIMGCRLTDVGGVYEGYGGSGRVYIDDTLHFLYHVTDDVLYHRHLTLPVPIHV